MHLSWFELTNTRLAVTVNGTISRMNHFYTKFDRGFLWDPYSLWWPRMTWIISIHHNLLPPLLILFGKFLWFLHKTIQGQYEPLPYYIKVSLPPIGKPCDTVKILMKVQPENIFQKYSDFYNSIIKHLSSSWLFSAYDKLVQADRFFSRRIMHTSMNQSKLTSSRQYSDRGN